MYSKVIMNILCMCERKFIYVLIYASNIYQQGAQKEIEEMNKTKQTQKKKRQENDSALRKQQATDLLRDILHDKAELPPEIASTPRSASRERSITRDRLVEICSFPPAPKPPWNKCKIDNVLTWVDTVSLNSYSLQSVWRITKHWS